MYEQLLTTSAAAKSLQSCPTLCDPIDGSPPGSPIPGILQARILEWGAIVIQIYSPNGNTEEAEVELFYEDLQDFLELTPLPQKISFSL